MADIGRQIRELFDEVADPIDIREIVARERRRGWRGWQIALAAGVAALLIVGGVVLLGSFDSAPVAGPSDTTPSEDLPYLGLDLEGWVVTLAGERTGGCGAGDAIGVARQTSHEPITPRDEGPIHINVGVVSADSFCEGLALDAADLGPPADPPFVNDHGFIEVMGHRARVFDEQGTFQIRWLIGSLGAGHIHIFGNNLTPNDAIAIAGSIVEMQSDEWLAILERFPNGGTTTTIAPDDPITSPVEIPDGPLSTALRAAIDQIPELAALDVEYAADQTEAGTQWGGVSLVADDGSHLEIITQLVPDNFDPQYIGLNFIQETGPNGEEIFLLEKEGVVQVVVIDHEGTMINLIIDRFDPSGEPRSPGALSHIQLDQAKEWALLLLDLITD